MDGQATDSAQILDRTSGDVKPLKAHLLQVRAWHTATVLPDGNVFIYGGVDQSGISSSSAEIFDPATDSFAMFPNAGLSARSHHNVTLLTSGQLLIAGGTARGDVLLFETASEKIIQTANALEPSRDGASSALLANGQVLIWGGVDAQGRDVPDAVVFNPADLGFGALAAFGTLALPEAPSNAALTVAASIPGDQAGNVPVSSRIAVRFSKFLDVTSMNAGTVTLIGPSGKTAARVVGTNNGQQLFVTPAADLMPGSHYTLFMNGLTAGEKTMPFTAIDFTTEAILPSDQGDGPWIPTADQLRGNWRVKEQDSPWIHQPPERQPGAHHRCADRESGCQYLRTLPGKGRRCGRANDRSGLHRLDDRARHPGRNRHSVSHDVGGGDHKPSDSQSRTTNPGRDGHPRAGREDRHPCQHHTGPCEPSTVSVA